MNRGHFSPNTGTKKSCQMSPDPHSAGMRPGVMVYRLARDLGPWQGKEFTSRGVWGGGVGVGLVRVREKVYVPTWYLGTVGISAGGPTVRANVPSRIPTPPRDGSGGPRQVPAARIILTT